MNRRRNTGRSMQIIRGDTLRHEFYPYLNNIDGIVVDDIVEAWFTVKDKKTCDDDQALIQVEMTGGLLVINKTPATVAGNATITITANGRCSVIVDEVETAKLETGLFWYDLQILFVDGTILTPFINKVYILGDASRVTA